MPRDENRPSRGEIKRQRKAAAIAREKQGNTQGNPRRVIAETVHETPYEITVDPSAIGMPTDILELYVQTNRSIFENSQIFGSEHADHINRSQENILKTAALGIASTPEGQPKKALLLGVGNCLDLPLEELAEMFDSLTLVELDRESVEGAVKLLPVDLQRKIHIIIADITGVTSQYAKRIKSAAQGDIFGFLSKATSAVKEINTKAAISTPNFGDSYAFVCSQLLTTQLGNLPNQYANNVVLARYNQRLSTQPFAPNPKGFGPLIPVSDIELFMAHQDFRQRNLPDAHVNLLLQSVSPTGSVYMADTIARVLYDNSTDGEDHYMVNTKEFEERLYSHFNLLYQPQEWRWIHTPTGDSTKRRQDFLVRAYSLSPKHSSSEAI